jgi:hypothetical protein
MHAPNHGLRHRLWGDGSFYVGTGYVQYRPELNGQMWGSDQHVGLSLIEPWPHAIPLSIWTTDRLTPLL